MSVPRPDENQTPCDASSERGFEPRTLFSASGDGETAPVKRRRRRISDSELRRIYNAISEQPLPAEFDDLLKRIDQSR